MESSENQKNRGPFGFAARNILFLINCNYSELWLNSSEMPAKNFNSVLEISSQYLELNECTISSVALRNNAHCNEPPGKHHFQTDANCTYLPLLIKRNATNNRGGWSTMVLL